MRELPRLEDGLGELERALLRALPGPEARFKKSMRMLEAAIGEMPAEAPALLEDLAKLRTSGDPELVAFAEVVARMRPLEELLVGQRPWRASRDPLLHAYATLIDMIVPFRTRVPLVSGRGNFGTQHGDPPADHMYTECRLTPYGAAVLEGSAPNLLVNGARGHFLPHNLGEVIDALVSGKDTLAPDFPCGGVAHEGDLEALAAAGKGTVRVRARMHAESFDGVPLAVLTEAPQDVELDEIVSGASNAMQKGLAPSISDIRDETAREGLRIVFVGLRGAAAQAIEAELFAHARCTTSLEVDGMVIVDGAERCLTPVELIRETARRFSPAILEALRAHATPRRTSVARF
jgi:hypothetical protein